MGNEQTVDHCIKTEGKYRNTGVYVVVVMERKTPKEVQVSLVFLDKFESLSEISRIQDGFEKMAALANATLQLGIEVSKLIKMLKQPPCEMSGIIGDALIAALEG